MRRHLSILLVVLLVALGGILWLRRGAAPPAAVTAAPAEDPSDPRSPKDPPASARAATGPGPAADLGDRRAARAQRDVLLAEILKALSNRPAAPAPAPARPAAQPEAPRPAGSLKNRGVRQVLGEALNRDFMPLADECITRAQERVPGLAGMLVLGIETVADEQLGAVVEQAGATPRNQVADAELLECLRETAYSLRLPPPPGSGREQFEVSLRVDPVGLDR